MIKRKFGMRYLNISQGRYNSFSHKNLNAYDLAGEDSGIDRFVTFNELEVIGILPYKTTGFANTVLFYDKDNDVTLAMSHCNNINFLEKGLVLYPEDTIYYEGTTGKATGNHIHLEIGKGKQTTKTKINSSEWGLKDWINIEDYFYIDEEYTTILNSPYEFTKGVDNMNFIEGYQKLSWIGVPMYTYLMKADQSIGMMSALQTGKENYEARATIDKIDNELIHYCKVNCNFFDLNNGQHYGVEQSFENDFAPKQDEWLCLYIDKEGTPHICLSSEYWLAKDEVILACSPFAILRHEGNDVEFTSSAAKVDLNSTSNKTMLLYMGNGKYAFVVTGTGLTYYQCRNFAKAYGALGVYFLDGGGSSQMIMNGTKILYTGRAIANVLTFYKTVEPQPTPPITEEPKLDYEAMYNELKTKYDDLEKSNANKSSIINDIKKLVEGE